MTLREQFKKERCHLQCSDACMYGEYPRCNEYVEWLESQIPIREQAAWDAAREPNTTSFDYDRLKYQSIEEWRNNK